MRSENVQGVRYYPDKGKVLKVTKNGVIRGFYDSFSVLVESQYAVKEITMEEMNEIIKDDNLFTILGDTYL